MNVLFLCRANVFRSQMAEAFFNKYAKGNNSIAKSAALITSDQIPFYVINVMKAKNLDLSKNKSKPLTKELVGWADLLVLMNKNLDPFLKIAIQDKKNPKIEIWNIKDMSEGYPADKQPAFFTKTGDIIEERVKDLIMRLDKEKKK